MNLSLNDTKTLSRPSQSAMGPLSTSVLTNKIVNPMNVGVSSYNRQFNYFDNDLLTAHSTEKYGLNPTLYYSFSQVHFNQIIFLFKNKA